MSRLTRTIYFVLALGGLTVAAAHTASASYPQTHFEVGRYVGGFPLVGYLKRY